MAMVRSELAPTLMNRCHAALLADGGTLLVEICVAIAATETMSAKTAFAQIAAKGVELPVEAPVSLRIATTLSAPTVLTWCSMRAGEVPIQAIGPIVRLAQIQLLMMMSIRELGQATAKMLFSWLIQLDLPDTTITIPTPEKVPGLERQERTAMVEDLRTMALLIASHAPDDAKASSDRRGGREQSLQGQGDPAVQQDLGKRCPDRACGAHRGKSDRTASARSIAARHHGPRTQFREYRLHAGIAGAAPFLDLLDANPAVGLDLIRKLVDTAVEHHADGRETGTNGFTVVIDGKPRFFPWVQTYFWSRSMQAREYSSASGLMALEAWSQERLDKGEDVDAVLRDILGPEGSCAAYLLIALDVLLSHWPTTRDALVPFVANPDLLANDRTRSAFEMLGGMMMVRKEPRGRVTLVELAKRPSRRITLERLIPYYIADDASGQMVRSLLTKAVEETGPYRDAANFGDAAFMGSYALNMLNKANWVEVEGGLRYESPPAEAEHPSALKRADRRISVPVRLRRESSWQ